MKLVPKDRLDRIQNPCYATTTQGRPCSWIAKRDSFYCHVHEDGFLPVYWFVVGVIAGSLHKGDRAFAPPVNGSLQKRTESRIQGASCMLSAPLLIQVS